MSQPLDIDALLIRKTRLQEELRTVEKGIDALRTLCVHVWVYDGHGHNEDHYFCRTCKAEEWR